MVSVARLASLPLPLPLPLLTSRSPGPRGQRSCPPCFLERNLFDHVSCVPSAHLSRSCSGPVIHLLRAASVGHVRLSVSRLPVNSPFPRFPTPPMCSLFTWSSSVGRPILPALCLLSTCDRPSPCLLDLSFPRFVRSSSPGVSSCQSSIQIGSPLPGPAGSYEPSCTIPIGCRLWLTGPARVWSSPFSPSAPSLHSRHSVLYG